MLFVIFVGLEVDALSEFCVQLRLQFAQGAVDIFCVVYVLQLGLESE